MPKCSVGVKEGSGLGYLQGPESPLSLVLTSAHWALGCSQAGRELQAWWHLISLCLSSTRKGSPVQLCLRRGHHQPTLSAFFVLSSPYHCWPSDCQPWLGAGSSGIGAGRPTPALHGGVLPGSVLQVWDVLQGASPGLGLLQEASGSAWPAAFVLVKADALGRGGGGWQGALQAWGGWPGPLGCPGSYVQGWHWAWKAGPYDTCLGAARALGLDT